MAGNGGSGGMFREQALEQLSSPEQLDELLRVTTRRSWLPIGTLAVALLAAIAWSVFGRIPVTVDGQGILIYPRRVVSFQAPAGGQIVSLDMQVGDFVERGQVVGALNQPELVSRLEQERARLAEVSRRNDRSETLRSRRVELERASIARQREVLQERIARQRGYAEAQKARNERYLDEQRQNLERVRQITAETRRALEERYASYRQLLAEGLSSEDQVLSARERLVGSQMQAADLELRAQELEMSRLQAERAYQEQMNLVADLEGKLQELDVRAAELEQQRVEADADRELQVQEIRLNIERYEQELASKGQLLSEFTGRVLELNVAPGQVISPGQRLGSVEAEDTSARLVAAAYFDVGDGKKVESGGVVRVSPATVERERHGSIIGEVSSVSPFPVTIDAITNVVGSREIAAELAGSGGRIQVLAELTTDPDSPSGYRWTSGSGPQTRVTAGTTASVRATVEQRRPISFVIPILRSWGGL